MYSVYIIHSERIGRYYVGSTNNLDGRIYRHNAGQSKFTKRGVPWRLVKTFEFSTRSEAHQLEMKVKKRGIERFLMDNKFGV
ncbi:MAG: GIY-YIG nuclease family protein [Cyclobacteriaceae bacterium]